MTDWLLATINHYIHIVPLEAFAFFASFIEEIIPPIPAVPIMLTLGGAAEIQGHTLAFIFLLAVLSSLGKTIGAIVVYHIVDKLEDVFVTHFGSFFNLKPGELEAFGARLGGGPRDYFILTFVRSFPLIPSMLVTVGSGLLRIPLRLFIVATFLGTIVRDGLYLYIGYTGVSIALTYLEGGHIKKLLEVGAVLSVILFLGYRYYKHRTAATTENRTES